MSRSARRLPLVEEPDHSAPLLVGPDGAKPVKAMVLTGVVRTSRGFAVATAELAEDGSVASVRLGNSQGVKEFVAVEHKRALVMAAQKA